MKNPLGAAARSAGALTKATAERSWAAYAAMPFLLLAGLGVLVVVNLSSRSLWGQLLYAVGLTTAAVWTFGRVLCMRLDIPPISVSRSLLWASFALMAVPIAVTHRPTGLLVLAGFPLLWLGVRALVRGPRKAELPQPWVGMLAGMVALGVFALATPRVASPERPPAAAPLVTQEDQADAELARTLRPVLMFDGRETRFPLDIGAAVEARQIDACRAALGPEACKPVEREAEFDLDADYLVVADVKGPRGGGRGSAYYYRVVRAPSRIYVDYWWYFTRNPTPVGEGVFCAPGLALPGLTCHDHPSDWEGVTVVLGPCDQFGPPCLSAGGARWAPAAARYAQHEFVVSYAWRPTLATLWGDAAEASGVRPLVYVANNSHASYPSPCPRTCKQFRRLFGTPVSEGAHDGRLPWTQNDDCASCLKRLPVTSNDGPALWNAFAGRWGTQKCILAGAYCDSARAPGAPSQQRRYEDPGSPGPWLCLAEPDRALAKTLRRCTTHADPDASIPGHQR